MMYRFMEHSRPVVYGSILVLLALMPRAALSEYLFGEPTKVPNLSSDLQEKWPQISRDGLALYFVSDGDIWMSHRTTVNEPWSAPSALDGPVNSTSTQTTPSISSDGLELYFSDDQCVGGFGDYDLWVSTRASRDDTWGIPVNLGATINSEYTEDSPCISADGLALYYRFNDPDNPRNSEILVSVRTSKDSPWSEPSILGVNVNSNEYEATPFISSDGLSLFFSRGFSKSHIWVSCRRSITDPWLPAQFVESVNSGSSFDVWGDSPGGAEYSSSFAEGDSTLYFCGATSFLSNDFDLWQVQVTLVVDFNADGSVDILDAYDLLDHWGQVTTRRNNAAYDIAPFPFGDQIVDAKDLKVLADHLGMSE